MPVDARLWLAAPPRSSHPACLAVKAAAEQGDPRGSYLRRLREGLLCRRRKLDTADALIEEARAVPGLDVERLRLGLASHGVLEAFAADLDRCGAVSPEHYSSGSDRVKLPSLEFVGRRSGRARASTARLITSALRRGGRGRRGGGVGRLGAALGGRGFAALRIDGHARGGRWCAICPGPRAPAELWRLALEWRVRAERLGTGYLWSLA